MTGYRTIVCDPPWEMPKPWGKSASNGKAWNVTVPSDLPYPTMPLGDICALPVDTLAERSAHLYVWTTNAFLEQTYDVVRGWNFRPSQMLTWAKTPRGIGIGGAFTNTTEFVLFAWRGTCSPLNRQDTSWWNWKRGRHSVKPDAFLDIVEQVSPGPYLEMFARRQRLGWDTWGNEALNHVTLKGDTT